MLSGIFNIYNCYVGEYLYRGPDFLKFQGKGVFTFAEVKEWRAILPMIYFIFSMWQDGSSENCHMLYAACNRRLCTCRNFMFCHNFYYIFFYLLIKFPNNHTDKYTTNERDINGTQHKQNLLLFNFYPYNNIIDFLSNASN